MVHHYRKLQKMVGTRFGEPHVARAMQFDMRETADEIRAQRRADWLPGRERPVSVQRSRIIVPAMPGTVACTSSQEIDSRPSGWAFARQ